MGKLIADGINGSDIIILETPTDDSTLKPDINKPADIENKDTYGIVTVSVLNVVDKALLNENILGTLKQKNKVKLAIKVGN